jgi:hypothetical protein
MKAFISYSNGDLEFAKLVASMIKNHVEPIYWDKDKLPGDGDWNSIFSWINDCPIVLTVVSRSVIEKGLSVGQEVGYAKKAGKVIIPFVSKNVKREELGCLKDLTIIHYDETNPQTAIKELETAIQRQSEKLQSSEAIALLAVGAIILLLLGSKS